MTSRYDEIMKTKPFLPWHVEKLTEKTLEAALTELGETEETKARTLVELRNKVQNEPKLVCPKDDAYLLQYLRPRKFNVKKAFSLLQNFYHLKRSYSDLYDTCEKEKFMVIFRERAISVLPYRDQEECLILVLRFEKWNTDIISIEEGIKSLTAAALFCVEDATSQINGIKIIIDAKGASLKHIRVITPRYITLVSRGLRDCLPIRFKGINIVNESFIFHYLWGMLKFFLSEKINKRVHFHGDNHKNLHKCINKDILPPEYGGDYTQFSTSDWFLNEIGKYYERFLEITTYGYKK